VLDDREVAEMTARPGGAAAPGRAASTTVFVTLVLAVSAVLAGAAAGEALAGGPFTGALPNNPVVQAMVDSVSIDRLTESVLRLVDFTTRHTGSDTVSTTTGVGAARNWVRDQFAAYSATNGGAQTAGFFDYQATVCGVFGAHRNVLSEQVGTVYPDRFAVFGSHLDTRTLDGCDASASAPGANDDGSGCATALELAYLLGKIDVDTSVRIVTFTGEEQGLLGSGAYATHAATSGIDVAAMFNTDIAGNIESAGGMIDSTSVRAFSGDPATSSSRQLARYVKLKGEAYQPGFTINLIPLLDRPNRAGDHIPFYDEGFAAARLTETQENGDGTGNGHQHNGTDLPEFMSFTYLQRTARVNVAAITSFLLAPKPPTGMTVADAGNGTDVFVAWDASPEADLAGYRVAYRRQFGSNLYYEDIFDAGNNTSFTITGLTAGTPINVSVSAYDTDFNESVFCIEQLVTPAVVPVAPSGFTAASFTDHIRLTWYPNTELDLAEYNVYRATAPGGPFALLTTVPAPTAEYEDGDLSPGVDVYYELAAEDAGGLESAHAGPEKGRLAELTEALLIVDATPDGSGGLQPVDAAVDLFYAGILSDVAVSGQWDRADSVSAGIQLSDADLSRHATVLYHADVFSQSTPIVADTTELRQYVNAGGRLLLSAARPGLTLGGSSADITAWEPGQFMHDVLMATETTQSSVPDFIGSLAEQAGYPDLDVDGSKVPIDRLSQQHAYSGPLVHVPETEVLYRYDAFLGTGPNHLLPNAIRHLTPDTRLVAFGFPLYFMDSLSVRQAVATALEDLGATTGVPVAAGGVEALRFGLQRAVPNPFNPSTGVAYTLDRREHVRVRLYDVRGRLVRVLVDGTADAGRYLARWDGRSDGGAEAASGVYFAELEGRTSGRSERVKLVLLR